MNGLFRCCDCQVPLPLEGTVWPNVPFEMAINWWVYDKIVHLLFVCMSVSVSVYPVFGLQVFQSIASLKNFLSLQSKFNLIRFDSIQFYSILSVFFLFSIFRSFSFPFTTIRVYTCHIIIKYVLLLLLCIHCKITASYLLLLFILIIIWTTITNSVVCFCLTCWHLGRI